jgi:hypothetical protein
VSLFSPRDLIHVFGVTANDFLCASAYNVAPEAYFEEVPELFGDIGIGDGPGEDRGQEIPIGNNGAEGHHQDGAPVSLEARALHFGNYYIAAGIGKHGGQVIENFGHLALLNVHCGQFIDRATNEVKDFCHGPTVLLTPLKKIGKVSMDQRISACQGIRCTCRCKLLRKLLGWKRKISETLTQQVAPFRCGGRLWIIIL